ncbi:MAG: response regulator transcription factor [Prevotella sp.]
MEKTYTKILVVDDEQDLCDILQYNLEAEGYIADTANSAEEALLLPLTDYSLILLDVMMGEMSGFQMARRLKADTATADIPIIFITALDTEDHTVRGLDIGADDYIAKPLSMKEVMARVKAVLRRTQHTDEQPEDGCIVYDRMRIDDNSKTVTIDGTDIQLTKIEYKILTLLVEHSGKVFSREDLLRRCWPTDTYVLDRTVDVNITRLRKKIGIYGKQLKTRFGYGYTFEK